MGETNPHSAGDKNGCNTARGKRPAKMDCETRCWNTVPRGTALSCRAAWRERRDIDSSTRAASFRSSPWIVSFLFPGFHHRLVRLLVLEAELVDQLRIEFDDLSGF